jgi:hypothetical protein
LHRPSLRSEIETPVWCAACRQRPEFTPYTGALHIYSDASALGGGSGA